jgi:hypothetical protein
VMTRELTLFPFQVRLSRNRNGDLTEVKSPTGRWIRFHCDAGRIVQAADSSRRIVENEYDSDDYRRTVKYPSGQSTTYVYEGDNSRSNDEMMKRLMYLYSGICAEPLESPGWLIPSSEDFLGFELRKARTH